MRDLEELIPQLETTMREKAELEQQLAAVARDNVALEEQDALRRQLQDALRRTTSTQEQLQADTQILQADNTRLSAALAQQRQVGWSACLPAMVADPLSTLVRLNLALDSIMSLILLLCILMASENPLPALP